MARSVFYPGSRPLGEGVDIDLAGGEDMQFSLMQTSVSVRGFWGRWGGGFCGGREPPSNWSG